MPDAPALQVESLSIRRARTWLITDFSWRHSAGRIAWIVGENGAGKSSLIRVLAGRMKPTAGCVQYTGSLEAPAEMTYYHPQMRLPEAATVADWHDLMARLLTGVSPQPEEGALAPPWAFQEKRLERLSTGEGKRLLLDALLRRESSYTLLDEPYEHLSGPAKETLTDILLERAQTSLVVVATNQEVPLRASGGPTLRLDGDQAVIEGGTS